MAILNGHGKPNGLATPTTTPRRRKRVCVIGAGAAGLVALRHMTSGSFKDHFEVNAYEQTHKVGGTWNYTEKTGIDENGLPIHSSMYRDLKTNLPIEIMEFPDFKSLSSLSYVPHSEVLRYLNDYARHYDLFEHVHFGYHIVEVKRDEEEDRSTRWLVTIEDLASHETHVEVFDVVLVCNGRYSHPNWPTIKGSETFEGEMLHSHDYRVPEVFKGKSVAIVGGLSSGIDICMELCHHARQIILINRSEFQYRNLPSCVVQLKVNVHHLEANTIELIEVDDETKRHRFLIDTVILATGYRLGLDFLDSKSIGLRIDASNGTIDGLWRHFLNIRDPSMALFGVCQRVIPFPFYHQQMLFYLKLLTKELALPPPEKMAAEVAEDLSRRRKTPGYREKDRHLMKVNDMKLYLEQLEREAGLEGLRPVVYRLYEDLYRIRCENIVGYKQMNYVLNREAYFEVDKEWLLSTK